MTARIGLIALALCAALVAAPAASAQEPEALTRVMQMTGKAQNGKAFTGSYTIDRFTTSRGRLVSEGTLRGRLGGRRVAKSGVRMPATVSPAAGQAQLPPLPNSCQILNLVLGPIHLDLLGLVVRTNRINVRIDAQRGPGNLLGNLLCAITGIFDPQAVGARQQASPLNAILALVPRALGATPRLATAGAALTGPLRRGGAPPPGSSSTGA